MNNTVSSPAPLKKRFTPHREPVKVSPQSLVRTSFLEGGKQLPLIVEPVSGSLDLATWAKEHCQWIEDQTLQYGGVLFRGFIVSGQEDFERFVSTVTSSLLHYTERSTPRTHLSDKVYTSTEFPASQQIMPHNEVSYAKTWPKRIWFSCVTPAETGGETPICDVRRVYDRIPAAIREKFASRGWMLLRNYGDGMGLPWRVSFGVETEAELERYCSEADIEWEWLSDDRLRTRQVRPAVARHPQTHEWIWFNHLAFWHLSSLPPAVRESMLAVYAENEVPYHTYYGDSSPIDEEDIRAISAAYEAELVSFAWRKADVLMLDNMLVAHARAPFTGTRKIIVSMGDPCSDRGL